MTTDKKPAAPPTHLRVRATAVGFYAGQRVKEGMTFTLARPKDFSAKWMVDVDATTPDDLAAKTHVKPPVGQARQRTSVDLTNSLAAPAPSWAAPAPPSSDSVI